MPPSLRAASNSDKIARTSEAACGEAALKWKILLVAVALLPAAASAQTLGKDGWRFTRWGMTPDEVADASRGEAPKNNGTPGDRVAGKSLGNQGSYAAGDYKFTTRYYFGDHGLDYITLRLLDSTNERCLALALDLQGKYGPADGRPGSMFMTWRIEASNTSLGLTNLGGGDCTLSYSQLTSPNASGL